MTEYTDFKTRHVAALLLIEARKGIRPPVMRNVKIIYFSVPRHNKLGLPPGVYTKIVEEGLEKYNARIKV